MKDLVVISYDDSGDLGKYFKNCRDDLMEYLATESLSPNIHCMHGSCNKGSIDTVVSSLDDDYCVIVYAHGNKMLVADQNGTTLIHENDINHYDKSIFYSTACSNAESLGYKMVNYVSKIFFGYKDNAWGLDGPEGTIFVETDNFALKKILSGCRNGKELYNDTYDFFYGKYVELEKVNDALAPLLYHNMSIMRVYEHPNKEYG